MRSGAGSCRAPVGAGAAGGRAAGADGHAAECFLPAGTWPTTAGGLVLTSQLLKEQEEYLSILHQVDLFCYMAGIYHSHSLLEMQVVCMCENENMEKYEQKLWLIHGPYHSVVDALSE